MKGPSAFLCVCLFFACSAGAALAAESAARPDVAGLVACKKTMRDWWNNLAFALADPANVEAWGWRKSSTGSGFLQVFELPKPIEAFGEKTSKIAFSGTGIVALLKRKSLKQLVSDLKLEPVYDGGGTRIFGRRISREVSLTASTSPDYPGFVLAGCSYQIGVE